MSEEQGGNNVPYSNGKEERIYVAIRVRPLNEKEKTRQDVSEWECVSHNTIKFKNNGHAEQRSSPDTYTFDRVFGEKCPTKQVYEQGIKEVALSVIRGINSSIFAYGQTSSGKTYTMTGITELAVKDIYEYIEKHKEREFIVKFSALEIYNEAVRDLLNSNATTLRLLDDPEKGTVVEKLTEETLTERSQLQQLISKCAAERTTEETAMNETSSRSHQILRLTLESNPSDFVGTARSGALFASVNFVDLAGSERASQALSAGTRLREGSHINRSLLTLGTVIRKLSKEKNGHIPYRDSKLTRILHNSLGGNARTAIICTISPARSQIEQSKNTLFFASCAKQVTTNARVNVVMSDKVLVKQLQNELARMENELKSLSTIILKEREHQIEQKDKEIKELTRQRDLFQNLLQSVGKDQVLRVDQDWASEWSGVSNDPGPITDVIPENLDRTTSGSSISNENLFKQPEYSEDNFLLDGCPPTFVGLDPCQGWEEIARRSEFEDSFKELPCVEIKEVEKEHKPDINMSIPTFEESEGNSTHAFEESEGNSPMIQFVEVDGKSPIGSGHSDQDAPQQKIENIKRTNNHHVNHTEKFNDSFESETCCMATISLPQVECKSSIWNGHSDQDAPQKKIEDIKRNNNHLANHTEKSNDSFESETCCMAPKSPPQVERKSSTENGHSDEDAPKQKIEDIKRTNNHIVNLKEKSNDSFESKPCCMDAMSLPQVECKSSIWNGHSDQYAPHKKIEDVKITNHHLVNVSEKSNDSYESKYFCMTALSHPLVECKSSKGNEHNDQDAPQLKIEDIKRTNDLVNITHEYNDSFESEPCCIAVMSPPQAEPKSSTWNECDVQNAPRQKTEDIERTNDRLVNLKEKSKDSFQSEPCCMDVMSPRRVEPNSSIMNGHSDQNAPRQKIEDIEMTNDHLVNIAEKSNDSFQYEPYCMAAMSPSRLEPKSYRRNGDSDQNAPHKKIEDIERTNDHLVNLLEKSINDPSEHESCSMVVVSPPQVDCKSSTGNGHSDQYVPQQKIEDIKMTNDHLVNLSEKSIDSFESEPCCMAAISLPFVDGKSFIGNGHSDQDAPQQKTEDIKRTKDHLVNISTKSNDSFESEPRCMTAMSLPRVDGKSSIGNGHGDQDAPQRKVEDIKRSSDHLVNLSEKSNDSFESESRCMAAISPPQVDKVDQENSSHSQFLKLEQNMSPSSSNKLDQEPTSPHQFHQEYLKTISPPQLDDMEQVSFKASAGAEKEYFTSLECFPEKLSEPKLRAKRRKTSKKSSIIHEMNASVEDAESVMDSDTEETSSVLSFVVRMDESLKPKPVVKDVDNLMVPMRTSPIHKNVNRVRGLSFPGVWGTLIPSKFDMQQRDIVELWDACNVPLVHRSYFFLLIKGELSDSVYLDVELRRLSFLKDTFSSGNQITGVEGHDVTPNSSLLSLTRERKMLSKQVHKKFSRKGREELYLKWGIDLKTKHRSIQLAWLIWTGTRDLNHIRESAALVAKLVGFINTGETSKKTFGFGFLTRRKSIKSLSWKDTMSTLQ